MPNIDTNPTKIEELLSRGVEDCFVKEDLKKDLLSGRQLRIKFGIDPTGAKLHIGHSIPIRKLRQFQLLGHQIVLIVGDFTAQIGDPTDKLAKRPMLTREVIEENMRDYKAQIGKIVDIEKVEFTYNSDWLRPLGFQEICQLAESFTVQQMIARRNFADRIEKGEEVSLRELMYPLMQGYDSVAVKADVEIGGFDQLFNLKAGRNIQNHYKQKEQNVLTMQMLEGLDGQKMSKTFQNFIAVVDEPNDMYGKIMSLKDELIVKYFTLTTDLSLEEVALIEKAIIEGENPKIHKMRLAREIVTMYHSEKAAAKAEEEFENVFAKGALPETIPELVVAVIDVAQELKRLQIIESKSEWTRLIKEGAVSIHEGAVIQDPKWLPQAPCVIKIGKRRFVRFI